MPGCEICGERVEEIYECKECSSLFCDNCGDAAAGECEFCVEDEG